MPVREESPMKKQQLLPPKLKAVLVRLVDSGKLNTTQAVKLPYLVDVAATQVLGRGITEVVHQAWKHGVVTPDAWRYIDRCGDGDPLFKVEQIRWSEEKRVRLRAAAKADLEVLTAEELAIVDAVAAEFSAMSARDLGQLTKIMNPEIPSWGNNHPANLGPDAYERMAPEYRAMVRRAISMSREDLELDSFPIECAEEAIA